jgi:hypothetical protein
MPKRKKNPSRPEIFFRKSGGRLILGTDRKRNIAERWAGKQMHGKPHIDDYGFDTFISLFHVHDKSHHLKIFGL